MDIAILLGLIILNGIFAMSEIALITARKTRLQKLVNAGDGAAKAALELGNDPNKFLSTVQIGITSIGVLNGIVGEAAFAGPFERLVYFTRHSFLSFRLSGYRCGSRDHHLFFYRVGRTRSQTVRANYTRITCVPGGSTHDVACDLSEAFCIFALGFNASFIASNRY